MRERTQPRRLIEAAAARFGVPRSTLTAPVTLIAKIVGEDDTAGWCRVRGLNSRPTVYKTAALPLS